MKLSQNQILLSHLLRIGNISGLEASGMYKVRSLTRRIADLKTYYGMGITSERKVDATGQRYVRYIHTPETAAPCRVSAYVYDGRSVYA